LSTALGKISNFYFQSREIFRSGKHVFSTPDRIVSSSIHILFSISKLFSESTAFANYLLYATDPYLANADRTIIANW